MIKKLPVSKENQTEKITESFKNSLILWVNQKQTGKLTFEVNTGQGNIFACYLKTESQI